MVTVLVTGASGFLGAHTVKALLDSGHQVRAFVRSPAKLATALEPLGVGTGDGRLDCAPGDMTDPKAVRAAVQGCDAVIHAAATYSFKRRDRTRMVRDNTAGTRLVLEAARDAGCGPLVHVSSTVALTRPGFVTLDGHSPLGPGLGPYSASKVASERVARTMQEAGDPVTIVNPGGIVGPHDPYLGESNDAVLQMLRGRLPIYPRGSLPFVDVRDCAAVLAAAVDHDPGGRYLVPAENVSDLHAWLREVTGRRLPRLLVPGWLAVAGTWPGYVTGWPFLPGAAEGARITACASTADATRTTCELGVTARPFLDALTDTVRWLVDAGHLDPRLAGKAI